MIASTEVEPASPEALASGIPQGRVAFGLPVYDLAVLVLVSLLLVAYSSTMYDPYRTPRIAILALALVPGIFVLVGAAIKRDAASAIGVVFLAWATVSTLASDSPRNAVFGVYSDTSLLFTSTFFACWALGRRLSEAGRRHVAIVLMAGLVLNALLGMLQVTFEMRRVLPTGFLPRPSGTLGNPVYYGGLLGGALVLAARLHRRSSHPVLLTASAAVLACSINLSGSRIALVVAVAGAAAALWGADWRRALSLFAAVGVGLVLSALPIGTADGIDRASSESGFRPRALTWLAASEAVADSPLVGSGPGRFQAATSPKLKADFARAQPNGQIFTNAHNAVFEYAATTGLIGVVLLLVWTVIVLRRARGPLAWFAVATALTWTLQPMSVITAPLVFVALGAASPRLAVPPLALVSRGAALALTFAAAVYSVTLTVSDYYFGGAALTYRQRDLALADRFRLVQTSDYAGARAIAIYNRARGFGDLEDRPRAIAAAHDATAVDPYYPNWWSQLGVVEALWGSAQVGAEHLDRSLELYRWSPRALEAQRIIAVDQGDAVRAKAANDRLCQITADLCDESLVTRTGG